MNTFTRYSTAVALTAMMASVNAQTYEVEGDNNHIGDNTSLTANQNQNLNNHNVNNNKTNVGVGVGVDVHNKIALNNPVTNNVTNNIGGDEYEQTIAPTQTVGDTNVTVPVSVGGPEIENTTNVGPTTVNTGPTNVNVGGPEVETGDNTQTTQIGNVGSHATGGSVGDVSATGGQGGQGGQGGTAEQEQGQEQAQNQGQNQHQTSESSSESESRSSSNNNGNSQVTNFEAAAAGSTAYSAPVYVPDSCMSGWSLGIAGAVVEGSGAFSFSKITPAGVDLGGLTLRDYLLLEDDDRSSKFEKRARVTEHLDEREQEKLTCLVAVIEEQEDIQAHELERVKMDQDFQAFYLYAQHALENDGPGATTTTVRQNGNIVTTTVENDEASIQEHAAITMAIAQRNPDLMLWIGAFSEVEIDGSKSATKVIRDYMRNEIDFDFKAEANKTIQNMFQPK